MGDDDPAYGSNDVENKDGQYGGTANGDDKKSAGGENDEAEDDENDENDENQDKERSQDETDPE